MTTTQQRYLGRNKPAQDHRDLLLTNYTIAAPKAPASVDYTGGIEKWGELGNDSAGDCTEAGGGHHIQAWTKVAQGKEAKITTAEALARYERLSGYVPGDESTDTGLDERTVLKDWLKNPYAGHELTAFGAVSLPKSVAGIEHFKTALWLFGGVYLGLDLPLSAKDQIDAGQPWDVVNTKRASEEWGGHAVAALAYDAEGVTVVTWGAPQRMTWSFAATYTDLAWGLVSADWLKSDKSPSGFNLAQLESDLKAVRAA